MSDKWIMQVPVLSTAHLTQEAMNELLLTKPSRSYYGMAVAISDVGAFLSIDIASEGDIAEIEDLPECMVNALSWVARNGYTWVRFDPDGDVIPELATYEW